MGQPLDPEWNWKTFISLNPVSWQYLNHANNRSQLTYLKIFNGEYLGYWGAPDEKSLSESKKIIKFKEINTDGE